MRLNVLLFPSLLLMVSGVAYAKEVHIQGSVFKDENQNGTRDLDEPGVPGIRLKTWSKHFYTDDQGQFSQTIDLDDEYGTLAVDEDHLPAGSIITTAPSKVVPRDKVNYSVSNFGISFKSKSFKYPDTIISPQHQSVKQGLTFEVKNNQLLMSGVPVLNIPRDPGSLRTESIALPLTEKGELKDRRGYENFIASIKKKLQEKDLLEVSTDVSLPLYRVEEAERLNQLSDELASELQTNFAVEKIKKKLSSDGSQIRINVLLADKKTTICRVYFGVTTFEVQTAKSYQVQLDSDERGTFDVHCGEMVSKIHVQIMDKDFVARVEKRTFTGELETFRVLESTAKSEKKNLPGLEVEQNLHLEKNRDQYAQFWIKSKGLRSYSINGRTFRSSAAVQPYLHQGRPGKNSLRLSMIDLEGYERAAKHEFLLFQQRRLYLSATVDSYDLRSRSSKFNFNYDIPSKKRVNLQGMYFLNQNWGVQFNHLRDVSDSSTELAGGGMESYLRTETLSHAVYRFKLFHSGYFAPVLHLYAGFQNKDSGLSKEVLIHYPKPFNGLSIGGELFKENIFTPHLASSTSLFVGHANADNRTLRFSQEFRLSLNELGKYFGAQKEQIYGPTYKGWNKVRLVLGVNYEMDEREAENADAQISDKTIAYRLGFAVQI